MFCKMLKRVMQKRRLQKSTVSVDEHLAIALPNLLEKNKLYKTLRVVCPLANIVQLSSPIKVFLIFYFHGWMVDYK